MWVYPYPVELAVEVNEQEKVLMLRQWDLRREFLATRGPLPGGNSHVVADIRDRALQLAGRVRRSIRSLLAEPREPQGECC